MTKVQLDMAGASDRCLEQLTTDHTIAQKMLDAGALSEDDAAISRWRHVLWNCVGGGDERVRPEAILSRLEVGDTVLLCSDGLTGMVVGYIRIDGVRPDLFIR